MKGRATMRGFRLIDGVVIAAVAMLALKTLGLISWASSPAEPAEPGALPAFGRVLAYARTNYIPPDVATTGSVQAKPKEDKPKEETAARPLAAPGTIPGTSPSSVSPSERLILERLGERRDELRQKSRDADERERLLEESERRLDARLGELKALQDKTEGSPDKKAAVEADGLKNIVTMYEAMKPKDAARVFDRLPQAVLVSVVLQMNPRKMSEVLAAMSPAGAEKLTVALANRSKDGGDSSPSGALLPAGELPAFDPVAPAPRR